MTFRIENKNYISSTLNIKNYSIEVSETLSELQANELMILHLLAKKEIKEDIDPITKTGLTSPISESPGRIGNLFYYLVMKENKIVGFGYSHDDLYDKSVCEINTIYIAKEHRGKKLSELLLRHIIEDNISKNSNYTGFKAITQETNDRAMRTLEKLAFINTNL